MTLLADLEEIVHDLQRGTEPMVRVVTFS